MKQRYYFLQLRTERLLIDKFFLSINNCNLKFKDSNLNNFI